MWKYKLVKTTSITFKCFHLVKFIIKVLIMGTDQKVI